ncbi:MAG: RnfABCDGE type electron transport complex subunit D [Oscillospiraceae bacterium]|nr:RnfABCDGE type electron transport complex subunit D [Oscillospiraceae bacterium]
MNIEATNLTVSSSPHAHGKNTTAVIMRDVCIALLPALIAAIYFFGWRALTLTLVSVAGCVFFEWGFRKLMKKDCTVTDWSAVVTGMLIAFVCPVSLPYWTILLADLFAIVLVKQLFGGIGMNIVNPALAARAFLFSWPSLMSGQWVRPGTNISIFSPSLDGLTTATPLEALAASTVKPLPAESLLDLFLGKIGGSLGEVSAAALLLGGVYLLVRKVISPRIPLAYLGTVAILAFLFPRGIEGGTWMLYQLLSGGLMLGAIFMATDYATSPVTHLGQIVYGVGCGVLTILFRYFGTYVEGVTYAILIMNCCVGFFDKLGVPKRFGLVKQKKGGAEK